MSLQKVTSKRLQKKIAGSGSASGSNSLRYLYPMDLRIRIRTQISWIRNTAYSWLRPTVPLVISPGVLQGAVCANPCPPGSYHKDCKRRCDCYNGAVCDHVNGKCHCLPGYQGTKVTNNRLLVGMQSYHETDNGSRLGSGSNSSTQT